MNLKKTELQLIIENFSQELERLIEYNSIELIEGLTKMAERNLKLGSLITEKILSKIKSVKKKNFL